MVLLMAHKLQNLRRNHTPLVLVPLSLFIATSNPERLQIAKALQCTQLDSRLLKASKMKCCCSLTLFLRNNQLRRHQLLRRIVERQVLLAKRRSPLGKVRLDKMRHSRQLAAKVNQTLLHLWIRKKGNCHQRMESLCLPALLLITRRIDPSIPTSLLTS